MLWHHIWPRLRMTKRIINIKKRLKIYKKVRKRIKRFWKLIKREIKPNKILKKRIGPLKRSIAHLRQGNIRFALYRYNKKIAKFDIHSVNVLLVAYPRSGSHWLRFVVEWLTGQPTHGTGWVPDIPIFLEVYPAKVHPLRHVDVKAPFVLHKTQRVRKKLPDSRSFILVIRNYRENVPRSHRSVIDEMREYCDLIVFYDQHKGPKLLIYYEDLLTNPANEIRRIADFFKVEHRRYAAFMERYDYLRSMSYQGKYASKASFYKSGDDLNYTSKKLDAKQYEEREKLYEKVLAEEQYKLVLPYLEPYRQS